MNKVLKIAGLAALFVASPIAGAAAITGTAIYDHEAKKDKESAYNAGYTNAKAEDTTYENDLRNKLKLYAEKIKKCDNYDQFEKLVVPLFAVAVSAANADGDISNEEKDVMKDVIAGLSQRSIPEHIMNQISEFFINPPTFNTAMEYVKKLLTNNSDVMGDLNALDEVIDFVIDADNIVNQKEQAFKEAWIRFKSQYEYKYIRRLAE